MSIEILLDVLLSAIVLYVYHSDCAQEQSLVLEFADVTCSPEAYDFAVVPPAPIDSSAEWVLDDRCPGQFADEGFPITGPVPDELIASIGESLGLLTTRIPVEPTTRPTVKQLRAAAKLLGVKNGSRMPKAELLGKVGSAMVDASLSELPIGDETLDLNVDGFSIT